MSLTADTAAAIVAVDEALASFEKSRAGLIAATSCPEYAVLKDAIEGLMETSLGEGMHFNSLEDARAYHNQPVVMCPPGTRWCVGGCGTYLLIKDGFRCVACSY